MPITSPRSSVRSNLLLAILLLLPCLRLDAQVQQKVTQTYTITVYGQLSITTTALPNGTIGQPYTAQFSAAGGVAPYVWSVVSGSAMPPGLALSSTGAVSGTPTQAGSFTVNIQVVDSGAASLNKPAVQIK